MSKSVPRAAYANQSQSLVILLRAGADIHALTEEGTVQNSSNHSLFGEPLHQFLSI